MIRGALLEGSYEGVLYYIRGYGTYDVPEDLTKFYTEKLSDVAVSLVMKFGTTCTATAYMYLCIITRPMMLTQ